jgi:hypothetical protein
LALVAVSTLISFAPVIARGGTGMSSVCIGILIGLPDIELGAATTIVSLVIPPVLAIGLSVNELAVTRALSITVTSSIFGSSFIGGIFGRSTVSLHLHEVKSSVNATLQGRNINVKSEFTIQKFVKFITILALQQIYSSTDIVSVLAMGDKLHLNAFVDLMSAIGVAPLGRRNSVHCTISGAGSRVRAVALVPVYSSEAVGISTNIVDPSPVLINSNFSIFGLTSRLITVSIGKWYVILLFLSSNILGECYC